MKCNKCGLENIENAKFCAHCGEKIESVNNGKKCVICGNENEEGAKYCAVCGSQLSQVQNNYSSTPTYEVVEPVKEDKFGTTSMVVGIVSIATTILCCMFPLGIVGGAVSTIMGIISLVKAKSSGKAVAGIICGALAFVIGLFIAISLIAAMNDPKFVAYLEQIMKEYENMY